MGGGDAHQQQPVLVGRQLDGRGQLALEHPSQQHTLSFEESQSPDEPSSLVVLLQSLYEFQETSSQHLSQLQPASSSRKGQGLEVGEGMG